MIINVEKLNESHFRVDCDDFGIEQELENFFSFDMQGAKFSPAYKAGCWDGKVRLYSLKTRLLHVGLFSYLQKFIDQNDYELSYKQQEPIKQFSVEQISKFGELLNPHSKGRKIDYRDYQLDAIRYAINNERGILISPTSCLDPVEEIEVKVFQTYDDIQNGNSLLTKVKLKNLQQTLDSNYSVQIKSSSNEYNEITDVYSKFGEGLLLTFSDGTELKAATNHKLLQNNKWIECKDLTVGDELDSYYNSSKVVIDIKHIPYQEWIDFSVDAPHESYYHKGLTHHNSGKSLIIYTLLRWYISQGKKCILVVPNTSLVSQMYHDFLDYSSVNGWNVESNCHMLYSGKLKHFDYNCTISTWQTLLEMIKSNGRSSKDMFEDIDVLFCDECHQQKGASANKIFDKMTYANIRIGTTGTLDNTQISELQLTGLFGPVYRVTTTKSLMDNKEVTPIDIKCLLLDHPQEIKSLCKKIDYQQEIKYLYSDETRNKFIRNLALSLDGVTLVLFNFIDHGKTLYKMINDKNTDENRNIHYVAGSVKTETRIDVRNLLNSTKNYRKFYFGDIYVKIYDDEDVILTDNTTLKGYQLTLESDIDNKWLVNKEMKK
jgi:superfamily II DNA or RNA helicase